MAGEQRDKYSPLLGFNKETLENQISQLQISNNDERNQVEEKQSSEEPVDEKETASELFGTQASEVIQFNLNLNLSI